MPGGQRPRHGMQGHTREASVGQDPSGVALHQAVPPALGDCVGVGPVRLRGQPHISGPHTQRLGRQQFASCNESRSGALAVSVSTKTLTLWRLKRSLKAYTGLLPRRARFDLVATSHVG